MKRLFSLWPACLLLLGASAAWALMLEIPMDQLVASSSSVVRGQVTGLNSHWTDDNTIIVTDVSFRVDEDWVGSLKPSTVLSLQVKGGEVGEIGQRTEHQPVFRQDQRAVLFLAPTPSARLAINYDEQGVFSVDGGNALNWKGQSISLATLKATVRSMKATH